MSASTRSQAAPARRKTALGTFERFLTLWVAACIVIGILLGSAFPTLFHAVGRIEIAQVNLPVAVLIWAMIIPMLLRVDFASLAQVTRHWRGIAVTVGVNWLIKPFSMAALGWLFIGFLFRSWLPESQIDSYIAGLILLAAAPCTAMVFTWSSLVDGDANFTISQVALNDTLMLFLFAPIVGLLLGLSSITVPWDTLLASVVIYIVVPLAAAQVWRRSLLASGGEAALGKTLAALRSPSLGALLLTLVILFALQGQQIVRQPLVILLLAIPIVIQVFFTSTLAYYLNRLVGSDQRVAGPSCLIGASNFFELAVAVAITVYGFQSGAALATVVGVLVEVPAMLAVVGVVNRTRAWYERRPA
jgi:ACR3 family arsenite transporter